MHISSSTGGTNTASLQPKQAAPVEVPSKSAAAAVFAPDPCCWHVHVVSSCALLDLLTPVCCRYCIPLSVSQPATKYVNDALRREARSGRYHAGMIAGDLSYAEGMSTHWDVSRHEL
jgi:hypothetical protein